MKTKNSRRTFIKQTAAAAAYIPFLNVQTGFGASIFSENELNIHIFSKHLQLLDYQSVGEKTAELGFAGVDLTVRKGGHVLPEFVKRDLPIAVEAIKKGGSQCIMMATNVENAENKLDIDVLETASKLGIQYYRSNWFKYSDEGDIEEELLKYQQQVTALSNLNKEFGIVGCYQNHAGKYVGSSIWEVKKLLEFADPAYFGSQYDIRHAMVEGGLSWENGLKLIKNNVKTIVLKDFKWSKVNGVWNVVDTPIGEGMVDFDTYFKLLKKYNLNIPVSLHVEYELGNGNFNNLSSLEQENLMYQAMRKDVITIKNLWSKA
ncbi:TIM barrel protein [Lutibacter sp.]|uniref:sugar phosphate isomerase/epimerase family protein n=1 Tax=Lutibacter sp. TaxID=1925666 RepID=UPI001A1EC91C|nr:TIM barrel protein [Lutibacter sp.]MBI9041174.1 sugar phosphate isomerase/epimerase [Lutibacter sp.]